MMINEHYLKLNIKKIMLIYGSLKIKSKKYYKIIKRIYKSWVSI